MLTFVLPWWVLVAAAIVPLLLTFTVWLIINRNRLSDKWNLRFKRSRVVEARLHTLTERVIVRYVVPNSKGFVRLRSAHSTGWYRIEPSFSEWNSQYGIPIYDLLETQIMPVLPTIAMAEEPPVEIEMEVKKEDGSIVREMRAMPVTVHQTFKRRFPQKMKMLKGTGQITAEEVHNMMESKIIERLALAQAEMVGAVKLVKILVIVIAISVVLSGLVEFIMLKSITDKLDAITQFVVRAATSGGA